MVSMNLRKQKPDSWVCLSDPRLLREKDSECGEYKLHIYLEKHVLLGEVLFHFVFINKE